MQYMGGKSRISKDIAEIINSYTQGESSFVSLFCGSCSIESKVNSPVKICNDKHKYLISMWKGLQNGYILPDTITKEQYYDIKSHLDKDKCLSGFVGFGCSFGGKWWGGYANRWEIKNVKRVNYAKQSKNSTLKKMIGLMNVQFTCLDYKDVEISENAVIYADPPYQGTTGYGLGKFDHEEFWEYMRELSKNHIVLISEENAPDDFECIWQKECIRTLDVNKNNQFKKIEKLFKLKNN